VILKYEIRGAILLAVSIAIAGCNNGKGSARKEVVNDRGEQLNHVCVVPLYKKLSGVAIGPDGKGVDASPGFYLMAPYVVDSGDDFMRKLLPSLPIIAPMLAMGTGYYDERLLLIKDGYLPRLVGRSDLFHEESIVLVTTTGSQAEKATAMILANEPKQEDLYVLFKIDSLLYPPDDYPLENRPQKNPQLEHVYVELDDNDTSLLRSCVAPPQNFQR